MLPPFVYILHSCCLLRSPTCLDTTTDRLTIDLANHLSSSLLLLSLFLLLYIALLAFVIALLLLYIALLAFVIASLLLYYALLSLTFIVVIRVFVMPGCCAVRCQNRSEKNVQMLAFPSEKQAERCRTWEIAVMRLAANGKPWKCTKNSRLCKVCS